MLFFSCWVVSDSLQPHGLQHTRLPWPSLSPWFCSDSCPLSQWCYIPSHPLPPSSPFAFSLSQHQDFFPMSWLFTSGSQSSEISASVSVLPMNIQGWFPLGSTGLLSLLSKGLSGVFSSTIIWKHQLFSAQASLWSSCYICTWWLKKTSLWLYGPLSTKWCLCFLISCLGLS